MICPRCNYDLVTIINRGEKIAYCPNCRDKWLDRSDLEVTIETSEVVELSTSTDLQNHAITEHHNIHLNDNCDEKHPQEKKNIFSNFLTFR